MKWENLTLHDKFKFFSVWSVIFCISNLSTIFGTFFYIFRDKLDLTIANFVLGFGCMLSWFCLIRYIETSEKHNIIMKAFRRSLPIVMRTVLSILPVFIGYVFLGMSLFWESQRFKSVSNAMFTLFSVMNGDIVFSFYDDLT